MAVVLPKGLQSVWTLAKSSSLVDGFVCELPMELHMMSSVWTPTMIVGLVDRQVLSVRTLANGFPLADGYEHRYDITFCKTLGDNETLADRSA